MSEFFLWAGFILSVVCHLDSWTGHLKVNDMVEGKEIARLLRSGYLFLSGVSVSAFGYLLGWYGSL